MLSSRKISTASAMHCALQCTLLFSIAVLAACTTVSQPEPLASAPVMPCIDTLAGAAYPKEVRSIPNQFGVGFFSRTFGDAFPVVERELTLGRRFVRVNLLWSDTHTFTEDDLPAIRTEAARYEPLCTRFEGRLFVAPITEHNIINPSKYLDAAHQSAPHCTIVNTPWKGGYTTNPDYINEVHGSHAVPDVRGVRYAWSDDGRHSPDTNFTKTKKKWAPAVYTCAWGRENNLRYNDKDDASRATRLAEANLRAPPPDLLESFAYLFTEKGRTAIPSGDLVKSHSDYHGPGDKKGRKLLFITKLSRKQNGKNLPVLLRRDGRTVCTLNYYGPYEKKGYHRYYSTSMGYQCGSNLTLQFNGRSYGKINGGFRWNSFRE